MFLLRLFLLAVATFFLADGASNHYPIAIKNRLLQEAPPADAIPLTLGVPSDPLAELMADSEAFFYLDLSPENAGTFITCSTDGKSLTPSLLGQHNL